MTDLRCGDALDVLRTLPDGIARCCVTSPPYLGLRDYGVAGQIGLESTPDAYVGRLVEVFSEVRRVLADDGTLWLNLGDSYAGSWGNQGRKAGRGTQRSINGPQFQDFRPYPKKSSRTGSIPAGSELKPKDLIGMPWRVAFALQADGWYLRSDIIWHKPNPMPESVRDRPTKSHEYLFLLAKRPKYYFDSDAIAEPAKDAGEIRVVTERSLSNRQANVPGRTPSGNGILGSKILIKPTRNRRDVWTISTKPCKAAHFAVMPDSLVEPCILAGSAVGDTVLDPFVGAGTVPMVAARHGRHAIGIDLNPDYLDIARDRIAADAAKRTPKPRPMPLFA